MSLYVFGPFHLDVERLLLLVDGEPVALGPKVVETLLALVEHPGEVLAKGALLDRIWPEGFVEEANLAQNIYVLRKTLRTHWDHEAIETVPRRGYRFTAHVRSIGESAALTPATAPAPVRSPWVRAGALLTAAVFIAVTFILGYARVSANRPGEPVLSENGARLYEIGHYYWNQRSRTGIEKSLAYFSQVVDSDPRDARGYAALAEANAMMGDYQYGVNQPKVYYALARSYAQKALALDPSSGEAHAALGLIDIDMDQNAAALVELNRAVVLEPTFGPAHEWLGIALLASGSLAAGSSQLHLAAELDPLSVATTAWLASAAYLDRNFDEAISYSRQALDLAPTRVDVLTTIGEAYEAQGNYTQAIASFQQFSRSCKHCHAEGAALLAHAYALAHRLDEARSEMAYASAHANYVDPTDLIAAEAVMGERSIALRQLQKMHGRMMWMAIQNDPRFDALRSDSAFRQLVQTQA
jgi:DNA-binding winged helix-turn-helix (wHTH) protein/tetratricopeptide (TPR) repeat protein